MAPNLQGKVVSAPNGQRVNPRGRARVQFLEGNWGELCGGRGYLGSLACLLRATTKKGRQLFFGEEKCTPRQNPGYAYDNDPALACYTHRRRISRGAEERHLVPRDNQSPVRLERRH